MAKRTRYQPSRKPKAAATAVMGTITLQPATPTPSSLREAAAPQLGYLTPSGYVDVGRGGRPIPPESEEGQAIQETYSRQFDDTIDNAVQYDRFIRYTKGEASIEDTLLKTGTRNRYQGAGIKSNRDKLIRTYFEERGIPLTEQFKNVRLSPTKYTAARARAKLATDTGAPMGDLRELTPTADDYRKTGEAMPAAPLKTRDEIIARRDNYLRSAAEVRDAAAATSAAAQVGVTGVGTPPGVPAMLGGYMAMGGFVTGVGQGDFLKALIKPKTTKGKDKGGYDPVSRGLAKSGEEEGEKDTTPTDWTGDAIIDDEGPDDYRRIDGTIIAEAIERDGSWGAITGTGEVLKRLGKSLVVPEEQIGQMAYYAATQTPVEDWKIKESALDLLINPIVEPLAEELSPFGQMNLTEDWGANLGQFGGALGQSAGNIAETLADPVKGGEFWDKAYEIGYESQQKFVKYPLYYTGTAVGEIPLMLVGAGEVGLVGKIAVKGARGVLLSQATAKAAEVGVKGNRLVNRLKADETTISDLSKKYKFDARRHENLLKARTTLQQKIMDVEDIDIKRTMKADDITRKLPEKTSQYTKDNVQQIAEIETTMNRMFLGELDKAGNVVTRREVPAELRTAIERREVTRDSLMSLTKSTDTRQRWDVTELQMAITKRSDDIMNTADYKARTMKEKVIDKPGLAYERFKHRLTPKFMRGRKTLARYALSEERRRGSGLAKFMPMSIPSFLSYVSRKAPTTIDTADDPRLGEYPVPFSPFQTIRNIGQDVPAEGVGIEFPAAAETLKKYLGAFTSPKQIGFRKEFDLYQAAIKGTEKITSEERLVQGAVSTGEISFQPGRLSADMGLPGAQRPFEDIIGFEKSGTEEIGGVMKITDTGRLGDYRTATFGLRGREGLQTDFPMYSEMQAFYGQRVSPFGALPKGDPRLTPQPTPTPVIEAEAVGAVTLKGVPDPTAGRSSDWTKAFNTIGADIADLNRQEKRLWSTVSLTNVMTSGLSWSSIKSDKYLSNVFKVSPTKRSLSREEQGMVGDFDLDIQNMVSSIKQLESSRVDASIPRQQLKELRAKRDAVVYENPFPQYDDYIDAVSNSARVDDASLREGLKNIHKSGTLEKEIKDLRAIERMITKSREKATEYAREGKTKYLETEQERLKGLQMTEVAQREKVARGINENLGFLDKKVQFTTMTPNANIFNPIGEKRLLMTSDQITKLTDIQIERSAKEAARKKLTDETPPTIQTAFVQYKLLDNIPVSQQPFRSIKDAEVREISKGELFIDGKLTGDKIIQGQSMTIDTAPMHVVDFLEKTKSVLHPQGNKKEAEKIIKGLMPNWDKNMGYKLYRIFGKNVDDFPESQSKTDHIAVDSDNKIFLNPDIQRAYGLSVRTVNTGKTRKPTREEIRTGVYKKKSEVPIYEIERDAKGNVMFDIKTPTTDVAKTFLSDLQETYKIGKQTFSPKEKDSKQFVPVERVIGVDKRGNKLFDEGYAIDKDVWARQQKFKEQQKTTQEILEELDTSQKKVIEQEKKVEEYDDAIREANENMEAKLKIQKLMRRMWQGEADKDGNIERGLDERWLVDPFYERSNISKDINETIKVHEESVAIFGNQIRDIEDELNIVVNKINFKNQELGGALKPIVKKRFLMNNPDYPLGDLGAPRGRVKKEVNADGEVRWVDDTEEGLTVDAYTSDDFQRFFDEGVPFDDPSKSANQKQYFSSVIDAVGAPKGQQEKLDELWNKIKDSDLPPEDLSTAYRIQAKGIMDESLGTLRTEKDPETGETAFVVDDAAKAYQEVANLIKEAEELTVQRRDLRGMHLKAEQDLESALLKKKEFRNQRLVREQESVGRDPTDPIIAPVELDLFIKRFGDSIPRTTKRWTGFVRGDDKTPAGLIANIPDEIKNLFPDGVVPDEIIAPTSFGMDAVSAGKGSLPWKGKGRPPVGEKLQIVGTMKLDMPGLSTEAEKATIDIPVYGRPGDTVGKTTVTLTPEKITSSSQLDKNQVWVMSTNMKGIHGRGNAQAGAQYFGGKYGQAEGMMPGERAFGVITKKEPNNNKGSFMTLDEVRPEIDKLRKAFATHPNKEFVLPAIGTQNARFTAKDMVELLGDDVVRDNVILPKAFYDELTVAQKTLYDSTHSVTQTSTYGGPTKFISGGQTGVDQNVLIAMKKQGFETGGMMPKGYKVELKSGKEGSDKAFAKKYGLTESGSSSYPVRTKQNVADADVTVYFSNKDSSPGMYRTRKSAKDLNKPIIINPTQDELIAFLAKEKPQTINIAGTRGSDGGDQVARNAVYSLTEALKKIKADKTEIPDPDVIDRFGAYIPKEVARMIQGRVVYHKNLFFAADPLKSQPMKPITHIESETTFNIAQRAIKAQIEKNIKTEKNKKVKERKTIEDAEFAIDSERALAKAITDLETGNMKVNDIPMTRDLEKIEAEIDAVFGADKIRKDFFVTPLSKMLRYRKKTKKKKIERPLTEVKDEKNVLQELYNKIHKGLKIDTNKIGSTTVDLRNEGVLITRELGGASRIMRSIAAKAKLDIGGATMRIRGTSAEGTFLKSNAEDTWLPIESGTIQSTIDRLVVRGKKENDPVIKQLKIIKGKAEQAEAKGEKFKPDEDTGRSAYGAGSQVADEYNAAISDVSIVMVPGKMEDGEVYDHFQLTSMLAEKEKIDETVKELMVIDKKNTLKDLSEKEQELFVKAKANHGTLSESQVLAEIERLKPIQKKAKDDVDKIHPVGEKGTEGWFSREHGGDNARHVLEYMMRDKERRDNVFVVTEGTDPDILMKFLERKKPKRINVVGIWEPRNKKAYYNKKGDVILPNKAHVERSKIGNKVVATFSGIITSHLAKHKRTVKPSTLQVLKLQERKDLLTSISKTLNAKERIINQAIGDQKTMISDINLGKHKTDKSLAKKVKELSKGVSTDTDEVIKGLTQTFMKTGPYDDHGRLIKAINAELSGMVTGGYVPSTQALGVMSDLQREYFKNHGKIVDTKAAIDEQKGGLLNNVVAGERDLNKVIEEYDQVINSKPHDLYMHVDTKAPKGEQSEFQDILDEVINRFATKDNTTKEAWLNKQGQWLVDYMQSPLRTLQREKANLQTEKKAYETGVLGAEEVSNLRKLVREEMHYGTYGDEKSIENLHRIVTEKGFDPDDYMIGKQVVISGDDFKNLTPEEVKTYKKMGAYDASNQKVDYYESSEYRRIKDKIETNTNWRENNIDPKQATTALSEAVDELDQFKENRTLLSKLKWVKETRDEDGDITYVMNNDQLTRFDNYWKASSAFTKKYTKKVEKLKNSKGKLSKEFVAKYGESTDKEVMLKIGEEDVTKKIAGIQRGIDEKDAKIDIEMKKFNEEKYDVLRYEQKQADMAVSAKLDRYRRILDGTPNISRQNAVNDITTDIERRYGTNWVDWNTRTMTSSIKAVIAQDYLENTVRPGQQALNDFLSNTISLKELNNRDRRLFARWQNSGKNSKVWAKEEKDKLDMLADSIEGYADVNLGGTRILDRNTKVLNNAEYNLKIARLEEEIARVTKDNEGKLTPALKDEIKALKDRMRKLSNSQKGRAEWKRRVDTIYSDRRAYGTDPDTGGVFNRKSNPEFDEGNPYEEAKITKGDLNQYYLGKFVAEGRIANVGYDQGAALDDVTDFLTYSRNQMRGKHHDEITPWDENVMQEMLDVKATRLRREIDKKAGRLNDIRTPTDSNKMKYRKKQLSKLEGERDEIKKKWLSSVTADKVPIQDIDLDIKHVVFPFTGTQNAGVTAMKAMIDSVGRGGKLEVGKTGEVKVVGGGKVKYSFVSGSDVGKSKLGGYMSTPVEKSVLADDVYHIDMGKINVSEEKIVGKVASEIKKLVKQQKSLTWAAKMKKTKKDKIRAEDVDNETVKGAIIVFTDKDGVNADYDIAGRLKGKPKQIEKKFEGKIAGKDFTIPLQGKIDETDPITGKTVYQPDKNSADKLLKAVSKSLATRRSTETKYILDPSAFEGDKLEKGLSFKHLVKDSDGKWVLKYDTDMDDVQVYVINDMTDTEQIMKVKMKLHEQNVKFVGFVGKPLESWKTSEGRGVSKTTGAVRPDKNLIANPTEAMGSAVSKLVTSDTASLERPGLSIARDIIIDMDGLTKTIKESEKAIKKSEKKLDTYTAQKEQAQKEWIPRPEALAFENLPDSLKQTTSDYQVEFWKNRAALLEAPANEARKVLEEGRKDTVSKEAEYFIKETYPDQGTLFAKMENIVTVPQTTMEEIGRTAKITDTSVNPVNELVQGKTKTVDKSILKKQVFWKWSAITKDLPQEKTTAFQDMLRGIGRRVEGMGGQRPQLSNEAYQAIDDLGSPDPDVIRSAISTLRSMDPPRGPDGISPVATWDSPTGLKASITKQYLLQISNLRNVKDKDSVSFYQLIGKDGPTKLHSNVLNWVTKGYYLRGEKLDPKLITRGEGEYAQGRYISGDEAFEKLVKGEAIGPTSEIRLGSKKTDEVFKPLTAEGEPTLSTWWRKPSRLNKRVGSALKKRGWKSTSAAMRKYGLHADRSQVEGWGWMIEKPRIPQSVKRKFNVFSMISNTFKQKSQTEPIKEKALEQYVKTGQLPDDSPTLYGKEQARMSTILTSDGRPRLQGVDTSIEELIVNKSQAVGKDIKALTKSEQKAGKPDWFVVTGSGDEVSTWIRERAGISTIYDANRARIAKVTEDRKKLIADSEAIGYKPDDELNELQLAEKEAYITSKDGYEKEIKKLTKENVGHVDDIDTLTRKIKLSAQTEPGVPQIQSFRERLFGVIKTPKDESRPRLPAWASQPEVTDDFVIDVDYTVPRMTQGMRPRPMTTEEPRTVRRTYSGTGTDGLRIKTEEINYLADPPSKAELFVRETVQTPIRQVEDIIRGLGRQGDDVKAKGMGVDTDLGKQKAQQKVKDPENVAKEMSQQVKQSAEKTKRIQTSQDFRMAQRYAGALTYGFETTQSANQFYSQQAPQPPFTADAVKSEEQITKPDVMPMGIEGITQSIDSFQLPRMDQLPKLRIDQAGKLTENMKDMMDIGRKTTSEIRSDVITKVKPLMVSPKLEDMFGKTVVVPKLQPVQKPMLRPQIKPTLPISTAIIPDFVQAAQKRPQIKPKKAPKRKIGWQVPDVWFGYYSPQEYTAFGIVGKKGREPKKLRKQNKKLD